MICLTLLTAGNGDVLAKTRAGPEDLSSLAGADFTIGATLTADLVVTVADDPLSFLFSSWKDYQ